MVEQCQRRLSDGLTNSQEDRRPECMIALGLSPPYTREDVKAAYFAKAQLLHPDHGGTVEDFRQLHSAFEQAQEFVEYHGDRRRWIASKLERYLSMRQAVERLEALGASITSVTAEWLRDSVGEFAQLAEVVIGVRLVDASAGDQFIQVLLEELPVLKNLVKIEMPGCRVSDDAVLRLGAYSWVRHLDLSRTPITPKALKVVDALPDLQTLTLDGTRLGWWPRSRVERRVRRRASGTDQAFGKLPDADLR